MKKIIIFLTLYAATEAYSQTCNLSGARLQNPGATATVYSTASAAVKRALPGAVINLGSGLENEELNVDLKSELTIKTECGAKINRILIRRSNKIVIEGIVIRPVKGPGVQLVGNDLANTEITLQKLDIEPKLYQDTNHGIMVGPMNHEISIFSTQVRAFPVSGIVIGQGSRGIVIDDTQSIDNLRHGIVAQEEVELTVRNSKLLGNGRSNLSKKQAGFGLANARSDLSLIKLQNTTIGFNLGCLDRSFACDISNPSFLNETDRVMTTYGSERPEIASLLKSISGTLPIETESYLAQSPIAIKNYLRAFISHVRLAVISPNSLDKGFASLREKQIKNCMVLISGPETREKVIDILDIDSGRDIKKAGPYLKRVGDAPLELIDRPVTLGLCKKIANGFSSP